MSENSYREISDKTDMTDNGYKFDSTKLHEDAEKARRIHTLPPTVGSLEAYVEFLKDAIIKLRATIDRQAEKIKAKDEALDDIRLGVRKDQTSVQWIEKRAKQGLEGE